MRHKIEQVCHFSSLYVFCLGCKTISRRAARPLIVLYPEQNIYSEQKWQTVSTQCQANLAVRR